MRNLASGIIQSTPGEGTRTLDAQIENLGMINVDYPTLVQNVGRVFDSTHGTRRINVVRPPHALLVLGGTTVLGSQTTFEGSGERELGGEQDHTLRLESDVVLEADGPAWVFGRFDTPAGGVSGLNGAPTLLVGVLVNELARSDF